ncbi:MAG: YhdP family protein [Immundisolibacter sp.]
MLVGAALVLTALRVALPRLEQHPQYVAALASRALGHPVEFARLSAGLRGNTPQITLHRASVRGSDDSLTQVQALRLRFDWSASLLARGPRLASLEIDGLHLAVVRQADGRWQFGGMRGGGALSGAALSWLLAQPRVRLQRAVIDISDATEPARTLRLEQAAVNVWRRGDRHRIRVDVGVGGFASGSFHLLADVRGLRQDVAASEGRAYVIARNMAGANVPLGDLLFGGQLDGELWLRWRGGRIERLAGRVEGRGRLQRDQTALTLDALYVDGVWQRTGDGWLAGVQRLRAESGAQTWRLDDAYLRRYGDRLALRVGLLDVAAARAWLALLAPADRGWVGVLAQADPTVRLRDGQLDGRLGDWRSLRLQAQVDELTWRPGHGLPGVGGLAGELRLGAGAASFALAGAPTLVLDAPELYSAPLQISASRGTVTAQWDEAGRAVRLDGFAGRCGDMSVTARARVSLPASGPLRLFVQASVPQAPARELFTLFPDRKLSAKFIDWGRRAIQGGTLSDIQLLFDGDPREFPFRDGQGQLLGQAGFSEVALDYQPGHGWPPVSDARGRLDLRGPTVTLAVAEAQLLDSRARDVQVRIPDVLTREKRLRLEGRVVGPAQDVIGFVQRSPLAARLGKAVGRLQFTGTAQTTLALDLVFTGPARRVTVDGSTRLDGNRLAVDGTGIELANLRGAIDFTRSGLQARGVQARFLGGPVTVDLASDPDAGLRLQPRGQADAAAVVQFLRLPWPRLFAGTVPWRGSVAIAGRGDIELDLELELAGAVRGLPTPLDVLQRKPLRVQARRLVADSSWDVNLAASPLAARLDLMPAAGGGVILRRGDLAIDAALRLPPAGFNVHGHLAQLPLGPWLGWLGEQFGGTAGGDWPSPRVDVYADRLDYLGQRFADLRLQLMRDDGWRVSVDAPDIAGKVQVTGTGRGQQVQLDLTRLHLDRQRSARKGDDVADPAAVPQLGGRIGALRYGGEDFGALTFASRRLADGLAFEALELTGSYGTITGSGSWRGSAAASTSRLRATADFQDFGALLARLGIDDLVRGGRGDLAVDVAWPGSPGAFDFPALEGRANGDLRDAMLPDVEPGVGRLFGILSLDSVVRRLTLDFRDVFGRGFAVDRMRGELVLQAGRAELRNLRVRGPAAHLTLNGSTSLVDRSLDVDVVAVPQVTSSLPLAGAIAAPGVGAAIFLGQKIFEGAIDKATEQRYHVTGTWAQPQIEKP